MTTMFDAGRLTVALAMLAPSTALASGSLEEAIQSTPLPGLEALGKRGATLASVDNIEALPGGGYALQTTWRVPGPASVVIPLKAKRGGEGCEAKWSLTWAPVPAFTDALVGVVRSGQLPQAPSKRRWTDAGRTPSMPVVMTRYQVITPFGARKPRPDRVDPRTPPTLVEVLPSRELIEDTKRWLEVHLEREPGAASVDLIADGRASWQDFQRVLYGVSTQGIFKIHFVTQGGGVVEAAAPIFGSIPGPKRPVPLVLGYYPEASGQGWRVSLGDKVLQAEPGVCAPQMTFCAGDAATFAQKLKARVAGSARPITHVMVATGRQTTLSGALPWVARAPEALGLAPSRVFVGYIQR